MGVFIPHARSRSASLHTRSSTSSLTQFSLSGLSVDPSLGMTQTPLEEKQKLFIQKPLSLGSHVSRGLRQKKLLWLKGLSLSPSSGLLITSGM